MKKILTVAAIALVAASCSKKPIEPQPAPGTGEVDINAPVSFGATANAEVTTTKAGNLVLGTDLTPELGIYAFKGATLQADPTAAAVAGVVWSDATNLEYNWVSAASNYQEVVPSNPVGSKAKLFWPGSGTTGTNLSFASYFPFMATGTAAPGSGTKAWVENYVLKATLADQTTKNDDYEFAWAKLENKARPATIAAQNLIFGYKIAKISLVIKSDEDIQKQVGGAGAGIKSVVVYSASTGLNTDYTLDLLTGTPGAGSVNSTAAAPIKLWMENQNAGVSPLPTTKYVTAGACLVPATAALINSGTTVTPANNGIVVAVTYNNGTKDETVKATINGTSITGNADAALTNGIVAGKNYKYTVTLTESQITFTGEVVDWVDAEYGTDIPLE